MKIIMEFDADADFVTYETYYAAPQMASALSEIRTYLRGQIKYTEAPDRHDAYRIYEEVLKIMSEVPLDL